MGRSARSRFTRNAQIGFANVWVAAQQQSPQQLRRSPAATRTSNFSKSHQGDRRDNFTCLFHFFRNWGMKWGGNCVAMQHYSSTHVEETFNGQGYDTEENDQEEAGKDDDGKARRQDCKKERIAQPWLRLLQTKQSPLRPSTCASRKARTSMGARWGLDTPQRIHSTSRSLLPVDVQPDLLLTIWYGHISLRRRNDGRLPRSRRSKLFG